MRKVEITIMELRDGGYVIADGHGEDEFPFRAVTSLGEAASAVRDIVERRLHPQETEELNGTVTFPRVLNPRPDNVVRPSLFKRLIKGAA